MSDFRSEAVRLQREWEWRKCAKDPAHFFRSFWSIKVPGQGIVLFDLRAPQERALKRWQKDRFSLTLKARQIGWSTLVAAYQFWLAFFHEGETIIDISRTEREAIDLLAKSKLGYRRLPEWMKDRGPASLVDHKQRMEFNNDSSIVSMPSASDPARGSSATLVVVDEWAFLPNPEDAWASIEPVTDIGGRVIGLSTANGSGNFFHNMWVAAETGNSKFKPMFEPWNAVTDRDADWYEKQKATLSPWQLHQEYPSNPQEAFIRSGRTIFDIDMLAQNVEPHVKPGDYGFLSDISMGDIPTYKTVQFKRNMTNADDQDPLTIWEYPKPDALYVLGADVAEGLEHGDASSAHVIEVTPDLEPYQVVAHWHGRTDPDLFGRELVMLGSYYNGCLVGVEANNHGLATINEMRRLNYKRLFMSRDMMPKVGDKTPRQSYGWLQTTKSKPVMVDGLNTIIREGDLVIPCADTYAELRHFVRDERGRMSGSPFDDRVNSLGIAAQMLKYVHLSHYTEEQTHEGTIQWWLDYANQSAVKDTRVLTVGAHNKGRHKR